MAKQTTLLHLNFPSDFLAQLDEYALARREVRRPLSRGEWLTQTPEGRELWSEIQRKRPAFSMRSTEDLNKYIQVKFDEATGGTKTGRPSTNEYRVEILLEAFKEYAEKHKPDAAPPPRRLLVRA